jgi:hypothetical protein
MSRSAEKNGAWGYFFLVTDTTDFYQEVSRPAEYLAGPRLFTDELKH